VDTDFRAESRHAVGKFLGLGHRVIALVIPRTKLAGDLASEAGFREGAERVGRTNTVTLIVHHDLTVESVQRAVESLWDRARPPTAILAGRARHFLTVLTHLSNAGARVPRDVSLVAREHEWFLDNIVPSVARYEQNQESIATKLSRLVVQVATTGVASRTPSLLMPRFQEGDTLAAVPR
jgi:LacI family transcriptional regulator